MNIEDFPGDMVDLEKRRGSSANMLISRKHPESPPDVESETAKINPKSERSTQHGKSNQ